MPPKLKLKKPEAPGYKKAESPEREKTKELKKSSTEVDNIYAGYGGDD